MTLSLVCIDVQAQPSFSEVAKSSGINFVYGLGTPTGGVSFVDFNLDGLDDITFAGGKGKPLAFYVNNGSGFTLLQPPPVSIVAESKQVLWADFDNDGDKDLYVATLDSRNYLFRNDGNLTMVDITLGAGLFMGSEPNYGAAWGDVDRDGWLDLLVTTKKMGSEDIFSTNRLYRNLGNGTFEDITLSSGLLDNTKSPFCASFIDFDNDLWPDIYIAQDKRTRNSLLINQHNLTFRDGGASANADTEMFGMSVACADIDFNGSQEIYITNTVGNRLLINHGAAFTEEAHLRGVDFIGGTGWGASFLDAENDGDADLYVSGMFVGSHVVSSAFYENDGSGMFTETHAGFDSDTLSSYSNATGDFNDDGFPDVLVSNADPYAAQLWKNEGGTHAWIRIKLKGHVSNRDGIGSRIEVFSDEKMQSLFTQTALSYLGQNSDWIHFGLGNVSIIDSIRIHWPSGHIDHLYDVGVRQKLLIEEMTHSSVVPHLNLSGLIKKCNGDSTILHSGLFGDVFNYLWSTGQTSPEITIRETGNYSVTVQSNVLGLDWSSPSLTVEISADAAPVVLLDITATSCFGSSDGAIHLEVSGGSTPYTALWNTGEEGLSMVNLSHGFYQFFLTDGNACTKAGYMIVGEPEPFLLQETVIQTSFGQFAIQLTRYGGVAPIQYAWNVPGAPNKATLTNLSSGIYSVVATDARGCTAQCTIEIADSGTITGLKDETGSALIYPNPVRDELTVRLAQQDHSAKCYQLRFISVLGQESTWEQCLASDEIEIRVPRPVLFPGLNQVIITTQGIAIFQTKIIVH